MEQVLVVDRAALEARLGGQTFTTEGIEAIRRFIVDQHVFLPRAQAEYDATVKQIIPYVLLRRGDAYFLLRRLKKQTETRLHDKLSLGVGGHINPTEEAAADPIEAGLRRELAEEVDVSDRRALTCVGVLNETTGGVSDYHAALVYVLETEKMSGTWATPAELDAVRNQLETWSQIALDAVIHGRAR